LLALNKIAHNVLSLGLVAYDSRPKPNKNAQIIKFKTNMDKDKTIPPLSQTTVSVSAFLTGKAKQDFEVFQIHRSLAITNADRLENYKIDFKDLEPYSHHIWRMDKTYLNALIIEWFDSVGLLIGVYPNLYGRFVWHLNKSETYKRWSNDMSYESRIEATKACIEKVNDIYNENVVEAEH
jgi:hypothetical protein